LASLHARAHGVSTPAVIAGAVYPAGSWGRAGFYTADLVTELVPRARSLADILLGGAPGGPSALRRAGRLVRSLERAGILHRDMSAANVVLDEAGDAWVVDLDRALLRPGSGQVGAVMLERLERSLHKLDRTHGRSLAPDERRALHSGFEDAA
jgi:tRNA A-37 threonylcarbamoyl transferase component Bud32